MRIIYLTRNQNYSGFYILKRLIKEEVQVVGVVLPDQNIIYDSKVFSFFAKILYRLRCKLQNVSPCKNMYSEKSLARKNKIPTFKVNTIDSGKFIKILNDLKPNVIFVGGGWHELIPEYIIKMFPNNIYNVHPSLLPRFKGTSITRWQILKGAELTGITIHRIDKTFDTGEIIAQKIHKVDNYPTPQELFKELSIKGADLVSELFQSTNNLKDMNIMGKKQIDDKGKNKYYKKWKWNWSTQRINLSYKNIYEIERFVRANNQESYYYIGPHLLINDELFIIRKTSIDSLPFTNKIEIKNNTNTTDYFYGIVTNKGINLIPKNSKTILRIELIQKWDIFLPIRRAVNPVKIFKNNTSVILRESPIYQKL